MKNNKKEQYLAPFIDVIRIHSDIITYSETEEWEGPILEAAED